MSCVVPILATLSVDTITALVAVYRVVAVTALGADCANTLYVAIDYAPISIRICGRGSVDIVALPPKDTAVPLIVIDELVNAELGMLVSPAELTATVGADAVPAIVMLVLPAVTLVTGDVPLDAAVKRP